MTPKSHGSIRIATTISQQSRTPFDIGCFFGERLLLDDLLFTIPSHTLYCDGAVNRTERRFFGPVAGRAPPTPRHADKWECINKAKDAFLAQTTHRWAARWAATAGAPARPLVETRMKRGFHVRFLRRGRFAGLSRLRRMHARILRYNTDAEANALVAQWIEQRTSNPSVAGSSPAGRTRNRQPPPPREAAFLMPVRKNFKV